MNWTEADEVAANMQADLLTIYTLDDALKHVPPADEVGYQVRDNMAESLLNRARSHRRNLPALFVIIDFSDHAMVLALDPAGFSRCRQSIAWQRQGGYEQPMHVCCYVGDGKFACIETGKEFAPGRSPYTEKAWSDFLARHNGEA